MVERTRLLANGVSSSWDEPTYLQIILYPFFSFLLEACLLVGTVLMILTVLAIICGVEKDILEFDAKIIRGLHRLTFYSFKSIYEWVIYACEWCLADGFGIGLTPDELEFHRRHYPDVSTSQLLAQSKANKLKAKLDAEERAKKLKKDEEVWKLQKQVEQDQIQLKIAQLELEKAKTELETNRRNFEEESGRSKSEDSKSRAKLDADKESFLNQSKELAVRTELFHRQQARFLEREEKFRQDQKSARTKRQDELEKITQFEHRANFVARDAECRAKERRLEILDNKLKGEEARINDRLKDLDDKRKDLHKDLDDKSKAGEARIEEFDAKCKAEEARIQDLVDQCKAEEARLKDQRIAEEARIQDLVDQCKAEEARLKDIDAQCKAEVERLRSLGIEYNNTPSRPEGVDQGHCGTQAQANVTNNVNAKLLTHHNIHKIKGAPFWKTPRDPYKLFDQLVERTRRIVEREEGKKSKQAAANKGYKIDKFGKPTALSPAVAAAVNNQFLHTGRRLPHPSTTPGSPQCNLIEPVSQEACRRTSFPSGEEIEMTFDTAPSTQNGNFAPLSNAASAPNGDAPREIQESDYPGYLPGDYTEPNVPIHSNNPGTSLNSSTNNEGVSRGHTGASSGGSITMTIPSHSNTPGTFLNSSTNNAGASRGTPSQGSMAMTVPVHSNAPGTFFNSHSNASEPGPSSSRPMAPATNPFNNYRSSNHNDYDMDGEGEAAETVVGLMPSSGWGAPHDLGPTQGKSAVALGKRPMRYPQAFGHMNGGPEDENLLGDLNDRFSGVNVIASQRKTQADLELEQAHQQAIAALAKEAEAQKAQYEDNKAKIMDNMKAHEDRAAQRKKEEAESSTSMSPAEVLALQKDIHDYRARQADADRIAEANSSAADAKLASSLAAEKTAIAVNAPHSPATDQERHSSAVTLSRLVDDEGNAEMGESSANGAATSTANATITGSPVLRLQGANRGYQFGSSPTTSESPRTSITPDRGDLPQAGGNGFLAIEDPQKWEEKCMTEVQTLLADKHNRIGLCDLHSMRTLLPDIDDVTDGARGWLNDQVINDFFEHVILKHAPAWKKRSGLAKPKHAFSSHTLSLMASGRMKAANGHARGANLDDSKFFQNKGILFPICTRNHWTLLHVHPGLKIMTYYDSLRGSGDPAFKLFREFLRENQGVKTPEQQAEWLEVEGETHLQENSMDCGVYTCINGMVALTGIPAAWGYRPDVARATGRHFVLAVLCGMKPPHVSPAELDQRRSERNNFLKAAQADAKARKSITRIDFRL